MRLWIDTDVGDNPDDAVALLCADAHPQVDVVGVSTSGGRAEWRAALARELVDVPIVRGDHVDELAASIREAAPDAFLAIGPLTNVAALVLLGVALPPLTVMGGTLTTVHHRGRDQRVEFNFARDPVAAATVVARTDATIVPLDATVSMRLDARQVGDLVRADARLAPEIARWQEAFDDPVVLHDPLALLACAGDQVVTIERRVVAVDREGRLYESGARLEDSDSEGGSEHAIVFGVDARAAVARVLGLLSGNWLSGNGLS